jgi:hypothetical protein
MATRSVEQAPARTHLSSEPAPSRPLRAPRLALALAGALSLLCTPAISAQNGFCETGGLVVVETESAALSGSWAAETIIPSYTGASYYRWAGANQYNSPGNGTLSYVIHISTPGDYQMRLRNHHNHPDSTLENDAWTRMDGSTWTKTYSGTAGGWTWATRFEHADHTKEDAHYQLTEGDHVFEISGRSQNFRIDRIHFYLNGTPGSTDSSQPESDVGNCAGLPPHPDQNPSSVTAVFADGTQGGFVTKSGTTDVFPNVAQPGNHLSFSEAARAVLAGKTYTDQDVVLRVRGGMAEGSWIGVILRAASEDDDFGVAGTQSMVFLQRQSVAGRVRAVVHDGTAVVHTGPWLDLGQANLGTDAATLRIRTTGTTVEAWINGVDALAGGYTGIADPAAGGYTSLRTTFNGATPGQIGVDYCLVRNVGDIPDVHFDADGKLWLSMVEPALFTTGWSPLTFFFTHQTFQLDFNVFVGLLLPWFDYGNLDADHLVLGMVNSGLSLPAGSSNTFEYKGQVEGEFRPLP